MNLIALPAFTDNPLRTLQDGAQASVAGSSAATLDRLANTVGVLAPAAILVTHARSTVALLATVLLTACASPGAPGVDSVIAAAPVAGIEAPSPAASTPTVEATASASRASVAADSGETVTEAPVDPWRPEVPVDLDDRMAQTDLWQRVRNGFGIADLDDAFVRKREYYYARKPDYVQRMAERGGRYLFHIVEEVQKRNLPSELALLPFIESAFNPQAMSSARASGMWQFMPATGRHFELTQNVFRDDRRDVLASTRAALDYLTRLHGMFGDWHLALAAYNWGEGNVQRAVNRNRMAGLPTDYSHLKMPNETRDYVPKLQAVKNIVANPQAFALELPALRNHPYFLSVPIARDIDVALAAQLAGLSLADFQALNPQMNKPVILAAGTPQLLLPYDNASQFIKSAEQHRGPFATWTAWVAPTTMKTAVVAKQVGIAEAELRSVNNIPPNMLVKAGSTLLVPRSAQRQTDVSEKVAEHATIALAPEAGAARRVAFRAGKNGDSVAAVAKRYRVSAAQVAQWNQVGEDARFAAGSSVVVFVAPRAAKTTPARATASKPVAKQSAKAVTVATAPSANVKR
jgi:membrane-bound lytic murein transglycosylase D